MMLLDIGNSAVKWAIREHGEMTRRGRFCHKDEDFSEQAETAWEAMQRPDRVAVANVAGTGMERNVVAWTEAHWAITPQFVRVTGQAAGVTNAYTEPGTLGIDRWAAMIAAYHEYSGPVCIIDCGTAITIDVVDVEGQHRGGLIAPGIGMMKRCLHSETAEIRITPAKENQPVTLLACGTREAIDKGVGYMGSAMIDRVVADIVAEYGEHTTLVITGGDVDSVLPLSGWQPHYDPDLVLKGIAILAGEPECVT
jgi:type III pantothenate kinase